MIEDFLTWVQLVNLTAAEVMIRTAKNQSNLVLVLYLVTMRKSYLFGMAFLLAEIHGMTNFFFLLDIPELKLPIYLMLFNCATLLTWLVVAGLHIYQTNNKNTLIACVIMILFLLAMATDSYINAYTETFIWRNYANIIVCIHVCIIISLYWRRFIFTGLVDKLGDLYDIFRYNVAYSYFWYTVKKINQGKLQ